MPSSRGSFQPRDWTWVSYIAGSLFINWATREAQKFSLYKDKWLYAVLKHYCMFQTKRCYMFRVIVMLVTIYLLYYYKRIKNFFSLLFLSHSVMSDSLPLHGLQHASLSYSSPSPGVCSNSCPLSLSHPTVSSSVVPFPSCLQSFPASGSFLSQLFASGGQSIWVSASVSVLPMNIQDWFPLGLIGLISLQSKGLSRVFPNTTVQKHQFFIAWSSLWSNSHIHTWLLENHSFD